MKPAEQIQKDGLHYNIRPRAFDCGVELKALINGQDPACYREPAVFESVIFSMITAGG
jgi:hypothetical protein